MTALILKPRTFCGLEVLKTRVQIPPAPPNDQSKTSTDVFFCACDPAMKGWRVPYKYSHHEGQTALPTFADCHAGLADSPASKAPVLND